jgi:hypothetical protein
VSRPLIPAAQKVVSVHGAAAAPWAHANPRGDTTVRVRGKKRGRAKAGRRRKAAGAAGDTTVLLTSIRFTYIEYGLYDCFCGMNVSC